MKNHYHYVPGKPVILIVAFIMLFSCTWALGEETWTCPSCGRTGNDDQFCPGCGASKEWICPKCGNKNNDTFCPKCGTKRPRQGDYIESEPEYEEPDDSIDLSDIRPGYRFYFGKFEQDGFTVNGKEPIVWRVLDTDESSGTVLAMSEFGLYTLKYHRNNNKTYWGDTDVRTWLNSEFLAVFSEKERSYIVPTEVSDSEDYCFLLDPDQVREYLNRPYICYATPYAMEYGEEGAYVNKNTGGSSWLVRTDVAKKKIAWVGGGGELYVPGGKGTNYLYTADNVARPVMWLKLEAATNEATDYGFPLSAKMLEEVGINSGPSTQYNGLGEDRGIKVVHVLSCARDNGGMTWLEIEYECKGAIVRGYTGYWRVDIDVGRVPQDILSDRPATVVQDTIAYYGPGTVYKQQVAKFTPEAGTTGTVLKEENGWYCFEYKGKDKIIRVWLPEDAVSVE